jgi:hypothetical protein
MVVLHTDHEGPGLALDIALVVYMQVDMRGGNSSTSLS